MSEEYHVDEHLEKLRELADGVQCGHRACRELVKVIKWLTDPRPTGEAVDPRLSLEKRRALWERYNAAACDRFGMKDHFSYGPR